LPDDPANPPAIRVQPELFRHAVRAGQAAEHRLYALLHDRQGARRWLTQVEALYAAHEAFGVSRRWTKHLLQRGDGIWWDVDAKHARLYVRNPNYVLAQIATDAQAEVSPILIPLPELASLHHFNALCFAGWLPMPEVVTHAGYREVRAAPIPRSRLIAAFGVTATTLRNWERRAGVKHLSNWAFTLPETLHDMPERPHEMHCECGRLFSSTRLAEFIEHRRTCQEVYLIVWQLANSYFPTRDLRPGQIINQLSRPRTQTRRRRLATHMHAEKKPLPAHRCSQNSTALPTSDLSHLSMSYRWYTRPFIPAKLSDHLPPVLVSCGVPLSRLWYAR
jgi:hypothetical protein